MSEESQMGDSHNCDVWERIHEFYVLAREMNEADADSSKLVDEMGLWLAQRSA